MDDREIVSAMKAGALPRLAGLGGAYDRYAGPLFDYCCRILGEREAAAAAIRDAFLHGVTESRGIRDPQLVRAHLYAAARDQCHRRQRSASTVSGRQFSGRQFSGRRPENTGQADLRGLINSVLGGLDEPEREAAELMFNHGLSDSDLAIVFGVSRHRASALAARARDHLEATLATPIVAHIRLRTCPVLRELVPGWDGRLPDETRGLVESHVGQCEACLSLRYRAFQPAIAYALQAPIEPPAQLRRQVIELCMGTTDKAAQTRQVAWTSESASSGRQARRGVVLAVAVILIWVAAAISATLLTILGSHSAQGLTTVQTLSGPAAGNHRPF
jgi:DNA-directed RNA polymerase specialized sigma24 family protein